MLLVLGQDDETDEEEWVRVREQVVAEVLSIIYLEVRSELLQVSYWKVAPEAGSWGRVAYMIVSSR